MKSNRPLAIVTGASSGIGLELAREAASRGYDLIIAADEPLDTAAQSLRALGAEVEAVQSRPRHARRCRAALLHRARP